MRTIITAGAGFLAGVGAKMGYDRFVSPTVKRLLDKRKAYKKILGELMEAEGLDPAKDKPSADIKAAALKCAEAEIEGKENPDAAKSLLNTLRDGLGSILKEAHRHVCKEEEAKKSIALAARIERTKCKGKKKTKKN